jgi:hypothetical protein
MINHSQFDNLERTTYLANRIALNGAAEFKLVFLFLFAGKILSLQRGIRETLEDRVSANFH